MNALSQPQNSHSSVGTMKNGTKSGPTRAQTALAIMLKETTNISANCASADDDAASASRAGWRESTRRPAARARSTACSGSAARPESSGR